MFNHQGQRNQYWPEVEQFFGSLPPHLFRLGALLKNDLAVRYSGTGQFKDILGRRYDYPLLDLHLWLLDDFDLAGGEERQAIERHLLVGMALAFAASYAHAGLLDQTSPFANRLVWLEQALTRQSAIHFARLFPGDAAFWGYYRAFWDDYTEASLVDFQQNGERWPGPAGPDLWPAAQKLALAKIPVAAVALKAGREAALPQLWAMVDRLNAAFQVRQDILAIRADLERGRYSYPIIRTMAEAGLDRQRPLEPEQVLGAMVLTGSIRQICQESLAHLDGGRAIARALALPTFIAYFDVVAELIGQVMRLFSFGTEPAGAVQDSGASRAEEVVFASYEEPLPQALSMAEGYLLADLTFRESWEVQRGGLFGVPEVTARAFPAGLIVEILGRRGRKLPAQVDELFKILRDNHFQYYDHPQTALPDADDLGLLLRLYRYSGQPQAHRDLLQTPLAWMERAILPSGEIPVWFEAGRPAAGAETPAVLIWGHSCAATEANLLLGLIDYDWDGYRGIIERSALSLFERLRTNGLAASLYYPPPYSLWVAFELMAKLLARPVQPALKDKLGQVSHLLLDRLETETRRRGVTPQEAAFWILTCCGHPRASHLFDPGWVTLLLERQRYDGSWDDEPLYLIPDRNRSAWYSSRSVTTAFCYHALKTYQEDWARA